LFLKHKVKKERGYGSSKEEYETEEYSPKRFALFIASIVVIVLISLTFVSGLRTVPSGYAGVKTSWGKIVGTAGEGLHWCNPFFGEDIVLVNVQIQSYESEPQSTASNDLQGVTTTVTVNYRVDKDFAMEVFRDMRDQYAGRVIRPAVEDSLKGTTAKFTSTEMIQTRAMVRSSLHNLLKERLEEFNIIVISVSMTDFQFSASFDEQLEATAKAEKQVLEEEANLKIVELQQQQKVITAMAEANATITKAEAEALAQIIMAESKAEAIRMIQEQLAMNPEYLEYLMILQWDGILPYFYGSDLPIPFLNLNEPEATP